jgi:hypothetical protein
VTAPDDVTDDAAWHAYCAELPDPTDAELAAVLADYHDPYADQRAHAAAGFRTSARMIWRARREGRHDALAYNYLRNAMRTYAATHRVYRMLTEVAALGLLTDMHMAASEG